MQSLVGVSVVSLAVNLPGPLAAARLTEFGAAVTKVEPPDGDPLAGAAPEWYGDLVRRQTVVTLDLKDRADRAKLDELLAEADLLITSMRPSALVRLGLDELQLSFPQLSIVEIVGYDGEHIEVPGHDLNYQAAHGILTPPAMPKVPVADLLGAERAVSAAMAALIARTNSGVGQRRRVVLEHSAAFAANAVRYRLTGEGAVLGGALPGYGIYRCADGYVALGAIEQHMFARTVTTFGVDGSRRGFERAFATLTIEQLETMAASADIPLNEVR
ncbi:CoA transferase [Mycobacterium angelicum]|uniref:CoA transferase n=1 Tax=Mycobacterium angelicum TaxID=470074 RepID=A0A1X0A6V2_MYCAN|nr:CoA transferase [Mycobacterium angelicum]MCV7194981.1 CoA transferase [Mycobacterium angelicum]ORA25809.1 CoA transferase [Mycobacterium angelicum]